MTPATLDKHSFNTHCWLIKAASSSSRVVEVRKKASYKEVQLYFFGLETRLQMSFLLCLSTVWFGLGCGLQYKTHCCSLLYRYHYGCSTQSCRVIVNPHIKGPFTLGIISIALLMLATAKWAPILVKITQTTVIESVEQLPTDSSVITHSES